MAEGCYVRYSPRVILSGLSWGNLVLVFYLYLACFQTILHFKSVKFKKLTWEWLTHLLVRRDLQAVSCLFYRNYWNFLKYFYGFFFAELLEYWIEWTEIISSFFFKDPRFLNYFSKIDFCKALCVKGNADIYIFFQLIFKTNTVYQNILKSIKA